jgi:HAD superfamily hydrolase (TIGR01509 family)
MSGTEVRTLPRAVLIDLDDTIFDHALTCRAALLAVRRGTGALRGRSLTELWKEYVRLLEASYPDVLCGRVTVDQSRIDRLVRLGRYCGEEIDATRAAQLVETYREKYQQLRRPVPGARALLESLHGRTKVAVVTNNQLEEQEDKLRFLGFRALIDELVVSEQVGVAKPDPRIFQFALDRVGVRPSETVMFGDSWSSDVLGARSAGVTAVWFNRFRQTNPEPRLVREVRSLRATEAVERALTNPRPRTAGPRATRTS